MLCWHVHFFLVSTQLMCTYFLGGGGNSPSGPGPPHSLGFEITHNDALQSVGLLWASDQPVAETSTWQHITLTRDRYPCPGGLRTHNLSRREPADLRLKPRGHWDRLCALITVLEFTSHSGWQNIFRRSTNSVFHHHTHNSPPTITNLIHINP